MSKAWSYEIRQLLGEGGMSEVYGAYDTNEGRTVPLKARPS